MQLCTAADLRRLQESGDLTFGGHDVDELLLDEHRVGLSLDAVVEIEGVVALSGASAPPTRSVDLASRIFEPGDFVLGTTRETVSMSSTVFGTLHTRSKFARLGLSMLGSANYVAPGSGWRNPTPLVFEMTFATTLTGLRSGECYSFMLIYELDQRDAGASPPVSPYASRFPLGTSSAESA